MLSLIFATLASSSIALLFKVSENGHYNRLRITTTNYVAALLVSLLFFLVSPKAPIEWLSVLSIGIPTGLCFFGSFLLYQQSVKDNGASLSAMAGKLGILLPMLLSILIWKEVPTLRQFTGIALALAAILYINAGPSSSLDSTKRIKTSLIFLFLVGGLGEFANKLFQVYGKLENQSLFLFVVFATACVTSLYYTLKEAPKAGSSLRKDIIMGTAIGIPNLLSSFFLIRALTKIPAAIAFPAFSAGSILIVVAVSRIIFKEAIHLRQSIGIAATVIALILIF